MTGRARRGGGACLVVAALLAASCSRGPEAGRAAAGSEGSPAETAGSASDTAASPTSPQADAPAPAPSTPAPPEPKPFVPPADAPLPRRAPALAHRLEDVTFALRDSVAAWAESGKTDERRPPRRVTLQALYQQRAYRLLARRPGLARRVAGRLDPGLRREARANTAAGAKLRSLVTPLKPPVRLKTGPPEPAGRLLRYYRRAERRFGVDWEVLAAVNYVETKFGRVRSSSSAGAQGPMQFLPSTWDAYGLGGDVRAPRDAILGAANYLRASGAPGDYRAALYAYNHSDAYVEAVLLYSRQMERRPQRYYGYYAWQVFVITTRGDVRLTGPGLRKPD
ncbi:MAG TPA: lytic transglycosylase domain-containing protein [Actinomycetota bacterium]|nr:lytic transglycosylase domain-containing protein [Actinomycetota bacterium]